MSTATIDAHFELYALRDGRWVLDACFADDTEAREEFARLSRSAGVRGTRLVREVRLPGVADPIVTVVADTTADQAPLAFKLRPAPNAAKRAEPRHLGGRREPPHAFLDPDAPAASPPRSRTSPLAVAGVAAMIVVVGLAGVAFLTF